MKSWIVVGVLILATTLISDPAEAQLRYFGYVGNADSHTGLVGTRSYTNIAHLSAKDNVYDTWVRGRVVAAYESGLQSVLDLGRVLWCPDADGVSRSLCPDWRWRLDTWEQVNASILTSGYVLAFSVRDEPFGVVSMSQYDLAAAEVKRRFPWASIVLVEAGCVVRGYCPSLGQSFSQFDQYVQSGGTLPNTDWVGIDEYGIRPLTDAGYHSALQKLKSSFPGKEFAYVMDAQWDPNTHNAAFGYNNRSFMATIAREWYDLARNDPDAVVLAGFLWSWGSVTPAGSDQLPCSVLREHTSIGRAITGKAPVQTVLPTGELEGIDKSGRATGWACDPDAAICESVQLSFHVEGYAQPILATTGFGNQEGYYNVCRTGRGHRFQTYLPSYTVGRKITLYAADLTSGSSLIASSCEASPSCIWYPNYYEPKGYLDGISSSGYATGWACDPDAPEVSIRVEITADGSPVGTYLADLSHESAVTSECGGGTAHRFGIQLPWWTQGLPVHAYGLDTMSGSALLPGWLCAQHPACVW